MSITKGWKYWSVFGISVLALSQSFAGFKHGNVLHVTVAASVFIASLVYLSFVMYVVEKKSGKVTREVKIFEKWLMTSNKKVHS